MSTKRSTGGSTIHILSPTTTLRYRPSLQLSVFELLTRPARDASDWPWYVSSLARTRGPAIASPSSCTPTTPNTRHDAGSLLTMAPAYSFENILCALAA